MELGRIIKESHFVLSKKKKCTSSTLVNTLHKESCPSVQLNTTKYCGTTIPLKCTSRWLCLRLVIHFKIPSYQDFFLWSYLHYPATCFHLIPYFSNCVKYMAGLSIFSCMYVVKDTQMFRQCKLLQHGFVYCTHGTHTAVCHSQTHAQVLCVKNACLIDLQSDQNWKFIYLLAAWLTDNYWTVHSGYVLAVKQVNLNTRHGQTAADFEIPLVTKLPEF